MRELWFGKFGLRVLGQRPGRSHGEILYLIHGHIIVSIEYDEDGDICCMYSNRAKDTLAKVLIIPLSKVWKRNART